MNACRTTFTVIAILLWAGLGHPAPLPDTKAIPDDLIVGGLVFQSELFDWYREGQNPALKDDSYFSAMFRHHHLLYPGEKDEHVNLYRLEAERPRAWITRIKLAHNRLFVVTPASTQVHVIPLAELHYWEDSRLNLYLEQTELYPRGSKSKRHLAVDWLFFDDPKLALPDADTWTFCREKCFDLLVDPDDVRWLQRFDLVDKKMKISTKWQPHSLYQRHFPLPKDYKPPEKEVKDEREVACPFEGYFTVHRLGDDYWFLTDSGKLYSLPTDPKKDKMVEVWNDPKRRLMGCIQHVDKKTVYAIVRGDKDGERAWFELSAKPELHEYTRTAESLKANPRRNEVPDAWATIAAHLKKKEPAKK